MKLSYAFLYLSIDLNSEKNVTYAIVEMENIRIIGNFLMAFIF